MATVVPWVKRSGGRPRCSRTSAAAVDDGIFLRGARVGTFAVCSLPSISRAASVNVPPTSMPRIAIRCIRPVVGGEHMAARGTSLCETPR